MQTNFAACSPGNTYPNVSQPRLRLVKPTSRKPFAKAFLEHLYVEKGMGLKRIAVMLNVGPARVRRELLANGIAIRPAPFRKTASAKPSVEELEAAKVEILAEQARLREALQQASAAEKAKLRP